MSIQAIKGVEVGDGFLTTTRRGSQAHDELFATDDGITRSSDRAGGTEGGMSTGTVLRVRAGMKPIATDPARAAHVDVATGDTAAAHHQRSDVCAVPPPASSPRRWSRSCWPRSCSRSSAATASRETRRNLEGYLAAIPETLRSDDRERRRLSPQHDLALWTRAIVLDRADGRRQDEHRPPRREARSGVPFFDTDIAVVARARPDRASSSSEHGEAHFRAARARRRARGARDRRRRRRSAAGRCCDPDTRADLAAHRVVLLTVDRRTSSPAASARRPARCCRARTRSPAGRRSTRAARPMYEELADITHRHVERAARSASWTRSSTWARSTQNAEEHA